MSFTEDELKENLRLEETTAPKHSDVNFPSPAHINNVAKGDKRHAAPTPAPLPAPSLPVTFIPAPVVAPDSAGSPTLPVATLSPPADPPLASPRSDPESPQEQSVVAVPLSPRPKPDHPTAVLQGHRHHPQLVAPPTNTKLQLQTPQQLLQCYPGSIIAPHQQHAVIPHAGPPPQPAPLQNGPVSSADDGRQLDKKRPGG